jgi:hypothetical protein
MKKKVIFFLIIYLPVMIFASQGVEQIINLQENIKIHIFKYHIRLDKLKVTDYYYYLTIYFNNFSSQPRQKYKILFNIVINGTEQSSDFICTNTYSCKSRYWSETEDVLENHIFNNFYKEPFILLPESANSEENIYSNFKAVLKIPRTATSIIFSGWVDDTLGKKYSNKEFNHIFKFTDYDTLLKVNLSKISFDRNSPIISIISPEYSEDFLRTEDHIITIIGNATDDNGIASIKLNDKKIPMDDDYNFLIKYKLNFGLNNVDIIAVDLFGNTSSKELIIYRDEIIEQEVNFSDVDIPLKTTNRNNAIAVVFGIEEYQYAPNVSNAYNDAEIMREYLISTFGLKRDNIYFRYNERATKGEFDKVFSENGWITKNSDKDSDIYIFYAGHGIASTDDGSAYLIPNDIDPNYASTGYSLNELYQNLSEIKSKSTTIILDACFSGVSRENEMLLADSRPISIEVKQGLIPKNLNVFTASSGNEISSGYSQKMHGLFTYYFLKGLNKNADQNNDKKITYGEMEKYLKEKVSSQAKKMGREQNPQLHTSDKEKILLRY